MYTYTHTHIHTYTYTYKLVYLSAEKGAVLYCFNFFNKSFLNDAFCNNANKVIFTLCIHIEDILS